MGVSPWEPPSANSTDGRLTKDSSLRAIQRLQSETHSPCTQVWVRTPFWLQAAASSPSLLPRAAFTRTLIPSPPKAPPPDTTTGDCESGGCKGADQALGQVHGEALGDSVSHGICDPGTGGMGTIRGRPTIQSALRSTFLKDIKCKLPGCKSHFEYCHFNSRSIRYRIYETRSSIRDCRQVALGSRRAAGIIPWGCGASQPLMCSQSFHRTCGCQLPSITASQRSTVHANSSRSLLRFGVSARTAHLQVKSC